MRTGLIVLGVIFLVVGGLLYFMPSQTAQATTTTIGGETTDTRTSYATVRAPPILIYALLLIGLVLLVLGLAVPGPRVPARRASETSTTQTKENSVDDDGTEHHVIHERHVRRVDAK